MKMLLIPALILTLAGCSGIESEKEDSVNKSDSVQILKDPQSNQKGDFLVSVSEGENSKVIASIAYIGNDSSEKVSHGSNIFRINVNQKDGDFKHTGVIGRSHIETVLEKDVPHTFELNLIEDLNVKKGTYEVEVIAEFSEEENSMQIPVSMVIKVD